MSFFNKEFFITAITNVFIDSKVPSPFRQCMLDFCNAHDITLCQVIRKGALRFIEDYEEEHGIAKPSLSALAKTQTRQWLTASC